MSFVSKIWKNRISANPNRRVLTPTGNTNEYEVTRSEGTITEEGDMFSADTMNDLESRIDTAISRLETRIARLEARQNVTVTVSGTTATITTE